MPPVTQPCQLRPLNQRTRRQKRAKRAKEKLQAKKNSLRTKKTTNVMDQLLCANAPELMTPMVAGDIKPPPPETACRTHFLVTAPSPQSPPTPKPVPTGN